MVFQINNIVKIQGLQSYSELNNKYGYIVKCCEDNRYGVLINTKNKPISIHEKNLVLFREMNFRRNILDEKEIVDKIEQAINYAIEKFDRSNYFSRGLIQQKMWNSMNLLYSESFLSVCDEDNPNKSIAKELNSTIKESINMVSKLKLKSFYTSPKLDKYIERSIQKLILDNL